MENKYVTYSVFWNDEELSVNSISLSFLLSFICWICHCLNMKSSFVFTLNFYFIYPPQFYMAPVVAGSL